MVDWRRLAPVAALLLFGVCANGPPPDGTEGTVGGGAGRYSIVSCGTRYFYKEDVVHAGFRNGARTGWSQSLDLSRYEESLLRTDVIDDGDDVSIVEPEREVGGVFAARVGYQKEHVGGELGVAIAQWNGTDDDDGDGTIPLPSANLWAGKREIYGWVKFLDGAFSQGDPGVGAGIGSEFRGGGRVRAGIGLRGPMAELSVPVSRNLRIGSEACFGSTDDWRVVGRLTFFAPHREARRAPPSATPAPEPEVAPIAPAIVGTAGP